MSLRTPPATEPNGTDTDVLVRTDNALGRITLNRPKAINALSLEMVRQIQVGLDAFENDPSVEIVLLDGAGDRGFCAGGDIVALQQSAKDGTDVGFEVANHALQLHGGYGYLSEYGIEKIVRDLRVHQILEGTNEIMRLIVARKLIEGAR
jgi:hypothetical protein